MTDLSRAFLSYLKAAQKLQKARGSCESSYYYCYSEQEDLERAEREYISEMRLALGLSTREEENLANCEE